MNEQKLDLILEKLTRLEKEQQGMRGDMQGFREEQQVMRNEQSSIREELLSIKADTADIPLIRRAVLETSEVVKQIDNAQRSFERKAFEDLNTHSHSIDILNRRQLKLEADVERLKQ